MRASTIPMPDGRAGGYGAQAATACHGEWRAARARSRVPCTSRYVRIRWRSSEGLAKSALGSKPGVGTLRAGSLFLLGDQNRGFQLWNLLILFALSEHGQTRSEDVTDRRSHRRNRRSGRATAARVD